MAETHAPNRLDGEQRPEQALTEDSLPHNRWREAAAGGWETEGFFESADGLHLPYTWFAPEGPPRAGLALVHGYDDHGARYAEVARRLASQGFAVVTFDYRGHGRAPGPRGHCNRFIEYVADLEGACKLLEGGLDGAPIGIVGHSHGALIALRLLCDRERSALNIRAAVLSSPYLGMALRAPGWKLRLARAASRTVPRLALDNGLNAAHLTHDEAITSARRQDSLFHHVATARWYSETLSAQAFIDANAHQLLTPTLWLIAGADDIADVQVTRAIFERAGGDKELRNYDGYYHELFHETGREQVFADVGDWLTSRFPRLDGAASGSRTSVNHSAPPH